MESTTILTPPKSYYEDPEFSTPIKDKVYLPKLLTSMMFSFGY